MNEEIQCVASGFEVDFYLENNRDVANSSMDPVVHYCKHGWKEGRNPCSFFNTEFYLQNNQDVREKGINPFFHFLSQGRSEGRSGCPDRVKENPKYSSSEISTSQPIEGIRAHFDSRFYLARYTDVANTKIDPLLHYWKTGWKEGRDPTSSFSNDYYLENNPDVFSAGINPFWHYIVAGSREGRLPCHPGGSLVKRLSSMLPLEDCVQAWRKDSTPDGLLDFQSLNAKLREMVSLQPSALIISVSHDNYKKTSGGVQLCIDREETLSSEADCLYLNIHPFQPLPRLAHEDEDPDPLVTLILGGSEIGSCRTSILVDVVGSLRDAIPVMHVVVHHMLGHSPERLIDLIRATPLRECFLWLHDFFTICPSYTLQRNNLVYCNAPNLTSNACTLCLFGSERSDHQKRMQAFFKKIDVNVVSPSRVTLDTWQMKAGLTPASVRVLPHMSLTWTPREVSVSAETHPITVGFLGTPAVHKGWDVFERVVRSNRSRYRFVFFGAAKVPAEGIDHVPVHVNAADPDAMIDAVIKEKCDLVLHWASWPETFSLSTFEALAGGAYVVTNAGSGNVAVTVAETARGVVLKDEAALASFFSDGDAETLVKRLREERQTHFVIHKLGRMSMELIEPTHGTLRS